MDCSKWSIFCMCATYIRPTCQPVINARSRSPGALAAQPECVLYDEPTTMVDPIMSDDLGNLMLRLKKQLSLTSVVVTHDLDLMRKVADSVMFLYKGEAIYFGPTSELDQCDHPHVRQFLAMDRVEISGKIEEV